MVLDCGVRADKLFVSGFRERLVSESRFYLLLVSLHLTVVFHLYIKELALVSG